MYQLLRAFLITLTLTVIMSHGTVAAQTRYQIQVKVVTRLGNIPIKNAVVKLDQALLGKTNSKGLSGVSSSRSANALQLNVVYENESEKLKKELFAVRLSNINPGAGTLDVGASRHSIVRVQDVLGSGLRELPGDKNFDDDYQDASIGEFVPTNDADVVLLKVTVRMATLSLQVPYMSQVGTAETIVTQAPSAANPNGVTREFRGNIICMPTAAKMCTDYWGIKSATGQELTRTMLMQACWDEHASPSVNFPCPWQEWAHLRTVVSQLADASANQTWTVDRGPVGANVESIPGTYANRISQELALGNPVVTSTYATSGHVMVVRGAVVDHQKQVKWLIFNDPYGNLASPKSVYGKLDIGRPVGLRGTATGTMNRQNDVRAVQESLKRLGFYQGSLGAAINDTSSNDPTVRAIKTLQGGPGYDGRVDPGGAAERRINTKLEQNSKPTYAAAEQEVNSASGVGSDRGQHVYYNGLTEGRGVNNGGRFRLKGQAWTLVIRPRTPLTQTELAKRITVGD